MGLKCYRLWVMGQLDSTEEPHHGVHAVGAQLLLTVRIVPARAAEQGRL
jgi:hypothetical protein